MRLGLRAGGEFKRSEIFRPQDASVESAFAARHFAAKRAGFLLRELARQQHPPAGQEFAELTAGTSAESLSVALVKGPEDLVTDAEVPAGPSPEELQRLVAEAEQRGRELALAELAAALDQAIAALDAAARSVLQMQAELEQKMVIPLAQASVHIGSELARQSLLDANGLARYVDAVAGSMADAVEHQADSPIVVHMNPEDLALIERASLRPALIKLVPDSLISSGGVTASGGDRMIDDRFENRVREVRELVLAVAADIRREDVS